MNLRKPRLAPCKSWGAAYEDAATLRICLLTDCYPPSIGGIEHYVYSLATHLGAQGHQVDVVTHLQIAPCTDMPAPRNVTVHRLRAHVCRLRGSDPAFGPRLYSQIERLLDAGGYDVVNGHALDSQIVLAGLKAARARGIPTVLTKHSIIARAWRPRLLRMWHLWAERRVIESWVDGVVTVSAAAAHELPRLSVPTWVVPAGVDITRYQPDAAAREEMRQRLGYGQDEILVGMVARMIHVKGWLSLPEIAKRVLAVAPRARFVGIGDGPLRARLQREIEADGLSSKVRLLGFQPWPEIPRYLNALDIFLFPSHTESCGMALLEAMACGKAAVARSNQGSAGIIVSGENGYLATSDLELADRVSHLVQDQGLRKRIGRHACAFVREHHHWEILAERMVAAYQEVIARCTIPRVAVAPKPEAVWE